MDRPARIKHARRLLLEHGWPEATVDQIAPVVERLNRVGKGQQRPAMEITVMAVMVRAHQYVNKKLRDEAK